MNFYQEICAHCGSHISMKERGKGVILCSHCETKWKNTVFPSLIHKTKQILERYDVEEKALWEKRSKKQD